MERHILLIDDDADELDFFEIAKRAMPGLFTFSYLGSAADAVKTIKGLQPDLVFLDMNMPGLNGLECLAEIKKESASRQVPVILYSTHIDDSTCKKAATLGAVGCVKKPVLISAFQKMLQDVLGKF